MGLDDERSVKDGLLKGVLLGLDRWHSEFDCIGKNKKHYLQAKPLFGSSSRGDFIYLICHQQIQPIFPIFSNADTS
ncbi:MAG: hypothetical protein K940chlam2_00149 [Chlamydiae bacterium]|nr:hypothetical protein [Chlamydiota bacterium]